MRWREGEKGALLSGVGVMLRAASRLTPTMWAYQVKRAVRNRLCRVTPSVYERHIDRVKHRRIPALQLPESSALAEVVSAYYLEEYEPDVEEFSRGRVTLFGRTVDFHGAGAIEWHHTIPEESDLHLWRMKLAHMGFLAPMLVSPRPEYHRAVQSVLEGFRQRAWFGTPGCFSSYWFPYSASHRVLAILSGLLVGRSRHVLPNEVSESVCDFLRWNAAFILANIEHELNNNHVERNLAALCFYLEYAQAPDTGLCRRIDRWVSDLMRDTVLPDGTQIERSSMYQGLSVMALRIFEDSSILSPETRRRARSLRERAAHSWCVLSHPDGEIALFNDSWFGEVPQPRRLHPGLPLERVEVLPDGGYARLECGPYFVLFDAGAIGPSWNPAHGHSDFLAVELDVDGRRFLVDPGTFQYSTGSRRTFERSAQSHNGPCWSDVHPVEYWGCFKVGRQSSAILDGVTVQGAVASVSGQLTLREGTVRREISVSSDGVRVLDTWSRRGARAEVKLTIPDEWELQGWAESEAHFRRGDTVARISVSEGHIIEVQQGAWACRYLESKPASHITIIPRASAGEPHRAEWLVTADRVSAA